MGVPGVELVGVGDRGVGEMLAVELEEPENSVTATKTPLEAKLESEVKRSVTVLLELTSAPGD